MTSKQRATNIDLAISEILTKHNQVNKPNHLDIYPLEYERKVKQITVDAAEKYKLKVSTLEMILIRKQ